MLVANELKDVEVLWDTFKQIAFSKCRAGGGVLVRSRTCTCTCIWVWKHCCNSYNYYAHLYYIMLFALSVKCMCMLFVLSLKCICIYMHICMIASYQAFPCIYLLEDVFVSISVLYGQ